MVTNCCLKGCKNESYPGSPVTFHSFPKDPVRRHSWLKNVKLKGKFYNSAKICSFHFKPEDYQNGRITKTAVPFYPELCNLKPPSLGDCMSSPTPDDEKSVNDATDCESIEYLQIDLQESEDEEKVIIEDHSPMPPVCRVCLTANLKMFTISGELIKTYEMMTNTKLDTDNDMPNTVCYYCHSELQKCSRFSSTARKAERVLRNWTSSNAKGILSFPNDLQGQVQKRNLSVTKQESISLDGDVDKGTKAAILQQLINQAQLPEQQPMLPVKLTPLPIKLKLTDNKISFAPVKTTLATNKKIKTENEQTNLNSNQDKHTDDIKNTKNNIKEETNLSEDNAKMEVDNTKLEYAESQTRTQNWTLQSEEEQAKGNKQKRTSFCKICNKVVPRTIREHNIRNHVMKKHVCEKCGFACKTKKIMAAHEKIHSNKCNIGWFCITECN